MCRGIIFGGLTKSFGKFAAAILSTLLFISLHFPIEQIIDLLVLITLSVGGLSLRLKTKAIGPSIAFHLSYNLMVLFMLAKELLNF
jgi:membrane protease YdiL (CAAX protease family)